MILHGDGVRGREEVRRDGDAYKEYVEKYLKQHGKTGDRGKKLDRDKPNATAGASRRFPSRRSRPLRRVRIECSGPAYPTWNQMIG